MKNILSRTAFVTLALTLSTGFAHAHHAMDGATPATFGQGLLSGFGHPVIGLDHLAFIAAAGLAVAVARLPLWMPVVFVALSMLGVGVHVAELDLPAAEIVIALTVIVAGALLMLRTRVPAAGWAGVFALAGLFHGYAYGEAVVGAETTPVVAYLVGLGIIQAAIALGVAVLASRPSTEALTPRLAGAVVLGVGLSAFAGQIMG